MPYSPRKISLTSSSANPNPKHNPEAISPNTSEPWRVCTRELPIMEMNALDPKISMNNPAIILGLRIGSFGFGWHRRTRPIISQINYFPILTPFPRPSGGLAHPGRGRQSRGYRNFVQDRPKDIGLES
jgi:hypothetical protein